MQRYLMPTCTGFTTSAEGMLMTSGRLVLIQKLSELQAATDFVSSCVMLGYLRVLDTRRLEV